MSIRLMVLLTLMFLACPWQDAEAETLRKIFKQVDGSVLVIQTNHRDVVAGPEKTLTSLPGLGSGVLISADGKVMTAAHLVQTADDIMVQFGNGELVKAKVVSSDPSADVALLQLEKVPPQSKVAQFGDSDAVEVGDEIFVVGAPLGLGHTLTVGHISARHKPNTMYGGTSRAEFFQTDAAINEGNSGGPMFNMKGEVIGIVSHIISKSGGFEGLGFVVTSTMARRLLLERNPYWSGVDGYLLTGNLAKAFNLPQSAGMLIQRISTKSSAAKLGLRPGTIMAVLDGHPVLVGGDIVLEVQGIQIVPDGASYSVIRDRMTQLKSGDEIKLVVLRGGERSVLTTLVP
ncbi:MAG: trypsin-like serine protease [Nitrospira sp.]|nr:trypsin-like serine protease [Nitrospira sp.]